jgi:hypothetical protein
LFSSLRISPLPRGGLGTRPLPRILLAIINRYRAGWLAAQRVQSHLYIWEGLRIHYVTELCARPAHGHSRVSIRLLLAALRKPGIWNLSAFGSPGRTRCLDAQLSTWTLFNQEQSVFQAKREFRLTSLWRFSREREANLVLLANLQLERTEDRFFNKVLGNRPGKLSFSPHPGPDLARQRSASAASFHTVLRTPIFATQVEVRSTKGIGE